MDSVDSQENLAAIASAYEDIPLQEVGEYLREEFFAEYEVISQKTHFGQRHIILARNLVARAIFAALDTIVGYRVKVGIFTELEEFVPSHAFETDDENLYFNAVSLFLSDKPQRNLKLLAKHKEALQRQLVRAKSLEAVEDTVLIRDWFAEHKRAIRQYAVKQLLAHTFQANDAVWGNFVVFNAVLKDQKPVYFSSEDEAQDFADSINGFASTVTKKPFIYARVYEQDGTIIVGMKQKRAYKLVKRLRKKHPKTLTHEPQSWHSEYQRFMLGGG